MNKCLEFFIFDLFRVGVVFGKLYKEFQIQKIQWSSTLVSILKLGGWLIITFFEIFQIKCSYVVNSKKVGGQSPLLPPPLTRALDEILEYHVETRNLFRTTILALFTRRGISRAISKFHFLFSDDNLYD